MGLVKRTNEKMYHRRTQESGKCSAEMSDWSRKATAETQMRGEERVRGWSASPGHDSTLYFLYQSSSTLRLGG